MRRPCATPGVLLQVCVGSSCSAKMLGAFDGAACFAAEADARLDGAVAVEEVNCLNACKRGPNAAVVVGGDRVACETMNSLETKRLCFQEVRSEERVSRVFGAVVAHAERLAAEE